MEIRIHPSRNPEDLSSPKEEFTLLERVARIVSRIRGTKPDYTRLAFELEQTIPFDIFGVVLLRHDGKAVRVTVCQRSQQVAPESLWVASYHQHPFEGSMLEQVLLQPGLRVINAVEGLNGTPAENGDALSGFPQLHSTLVVPLMVGQGEAQARHGTVDAGEGRVLGTLELGSYRAYTYNDQNLQRLVEAVADVLAAAIERVQLGGSAEIQNKQRQALKDVSSALTSDVDLSTILEQIVVGIEQALNVASVLLLLDPREGILRLAAQAGLDEGVCTHIFGNGIPLSEQCVLGYSIIHRQPALSLDVALDEQFPYNRVLAQAHGIRSIYSYPLMTGTTIYGLLVLFSHETGGFTPLKMDIFSLFASQASIAIHNSMLLESARQRSRFQEAIEQLERAGMSKRAALQRGHEPMDSVLPDQRLDEEAELLTHVREETQRIFGVSFSSLLRFMSDHLLTQDERNLQTVLQRYTAQDMLIGVGEPPVADKKSVYTSDQQLQTTSTSRPPVQAHKRPLSDTLALLTRTAEAALVRAGMLGELGGLLMQLRQSANSVKDAWFVIDLDGICIYMNPAAEALCGIRLDTAPDLPLEQAFSMLRPRMRNAEEMHLYLREFLRGSGYRQDIRCVLSTEPIHISALAIELEQKAYQDPLSKKKNSLRLESSPSDYHYQLVRYPLHNNSDQLVGNALQMCDVTEQVRDEKNRSALLSSVSHDLRTPLTTIKAAVTGLLQPGVTWSEDELHAMLEDIDGEADHLTVLVSALVELSRIEMGALHLEKEWCDIVEIVHGAVKKAGRVLAGRPVRVQAQPILPLVYVDHVQMDRVMYNLLENATRHSPTKTEILIEVDTQEQQVSTPTEVPVVRVKVTDRGSGVPVYERERIFKSFYGLRSYGNGLGLAICKGIIEAHSGSIWVEGPTDTFQSKQQQILQEEEDIVMRVTKQLEQQKTQEGACFIFTLPTYPTATTVAHDHLLAQREERISQSETEPLGSAFMYEVLSVKKDWVLEGSRVESTSEEPQ